MPLRFSDILGQDDAIDTLQRAYKADRLPHGLIFAGPAGVGKGTTATAMAALFLCEKPLKSAEPCGKCDSCRLIESNTHPDFHLLYKELIRVYDKTGKSKGTTFSINVIRPELVAKAALKSALGQGKVFVIEQAELMEPPAQNAMLKTLEEPAGRTLIVLLTDSPGLLLPTIRSRCQMIRFAPLPPEVVQEQLKAKKIDAATAKDAASLADGSLGVALKWIEDGVIDPARQLTKLMDSILAGGDGAGELPGFFKKAAEAYAEKQLERDELASKDQANREAMGLFLKIAADRCRWKLAKASPAEQDRLCSAIEAIVRAEQYLDSNVNTALVFQQLSLAL
jgi:DNA polymerase-3 subunit delta'